MNKVVIIGNLTRDPELRTTTTGVNVCQFTVAVNRRNHSQSQQNSNQPEADFFRVSAWRQQGELCNKYLAKGSKVCVTGPVSISTYTGNDGTTRASLEVTADDVEFLVSKVQSEAPATATPEVATQKQPKTTTSKQAPAAAATAYDALPY